MKRIKYILLVIVVALLYFNSSAQVVVKDTAFANFLCEKHPSVMELGCTTIDTANAINLLDDTLNASKRGTIKQIDEIIYFKNLTSIDLSVNKISKIPELSNLSKLIQLNIGENSFTELPDLSALPNIRNLIIRYSHVSELKGIDKLSNLEILLMDHSDLKIIPDFSQCVKLKTVDLSNNYLSFQDLMPLTAFSGFDLIFTIFPQKNLTNDTIINVHQYNKLSLKFPFDDNVSGLTYKWYCNDTLIKTTLINELIIDPIQPNESGIYYVEVSSSNPLLTGYLRSGNWHIKVDSICNDILSYSFAKEISCDIIKVGVQNLELSNTTRQFYSYLINQTTQQKKQLLSDSLIDITPGTYDLMVTDSLYCALIKTDALEIDYAGDCEKYFTPDGDGDSDTWLIKGTGTINIIDISGKLVKTLTAPVIWDGTDYNNKILPDGKYAIINQDSKVVQTITIIKF